MTKSRVVEVYANMQLDLLNGVYAPGSPLRIEKICKHMDASQGAVREALARLTSDGLVNALPQRGFIAAPVSKKDLIDLTKVRIEIEIKCIESSINLGDLDWEARLSSSYYRLTRTSVEPDKETGRVSAQWTKIHSEFHDSLISACESEWWLKLRNHMFIQAERYRRMLPLNKKINRDIDFEHKEIMDAALDRDASTAAKLLTNHLQNTTDILLSSGILDDNILEKTKTKKSA